MNISIIYLLYLCFFLAYTLTLDFENQCQCSDLVNLEDCGEDEGGCIWNKKSCEEVPCSNIKKYVECIFQSKRCQWSLGQCKDFTNCSSIIGATTDECKNQNFNCPASNGTNCGPIDQLLACSAIKYEITCHNYYSQEGVCVWKGDQCILANSCQQFYNATAQMCEYQGCQLSGNTCLPLTCSQQITQELCRGGVRIIGPYLQNVIACQWNSATLTCEDFDQSTIGIDECYEYSYGTYHWSNSKPNKGSCSKCFERLLKIIFVVIISLFQ